MGTKMKGLIKGLKQFSNRFENKEEEIQIGLPTDVKHVAHIGWDGPSSLESPSWMKEFKRGGAPQSAPLDFSAPPVENSEKKWVSQDSTSKKSLKSSSRNLPELPKSSRRQSTDSPAASPTPLRDPSRSRSSRRQSTDSPAASPTPLRDPSRSRSSRRQSTDSPAASPTPLRDPSRSRSSRRQSTDSPAASPAPLRDPSRSRSSRRHLRKESEGSSRGSRRTKELSTDAPDQGDIPKRTRRKKSKDSSVHRSSKTREKDKEPSVYGSSQESLPSTTFSDPFSESASVSVDSITMSPGNELLPASKLKPFVPEVEKANVAVA